MRSLILLLMLAAPFAQAAPPAAAAAPAKETKIKLGLEAGRTNEGGRDTRVFTIPIICGDAKANFTWGCGGQTIISASFAEKARLAIRANDELKAMVDGNGNSLFLGDASVDIVFGERSHPATAWIMRDGEFNMSVPGVIGYEIARQYQWEIDPRIPQLTLRPLGTPRKGKTLATIPLKDENDNLWIKVKVRNADEDVCLMPQTPEFQASPQLQKAWDMDRAGQKDDKLKSYLGNVRVLTMHGKDGVWLNSQIFEGDVIAYLLADNPNARSAVGQAILNRYVYCVDPELKQMLLIERVAGAATKPATGPASGK